MGFHDLRMFNDAMLGKQVWRLFHDRTSLVYKVFQAKYFTSGNIFDAVVSPRYSFAWRSILQSQEGVLRGAQWRVGDGRDINIWSDRWLPFDGRGRILSPQMDLSLNMVHDLLLSGTTLWNEELLDVNFYPWEAKAIKNIHISQIETVDALIWPHTTDAEYSVQSAYRLLVATQQQDQPSASDTEARKDLWNGIWKLKVPNKVRHFLWRAVRESLPTKSNLHRRQVLSSGVCEACGDCIKDGIHALWLCDAVKPIWMLDARFSFLRAHQFSNFGDLFQFLCLRGSSNLIALFAMASWGIWER